MTTRETELPAIRERLTNLSKRLEATKGKVNKTMDSTDVIPIVIGIKDGGCFFGEVEKGTDLRITTGPLALLLTNCHMLLGASQAMRGWFDLAERGPDSGCTVSPPVQQAIISEITKILFCSDAAALRWKEQAGLLPTTPITPIQTRKQ